MRITVRDLTRFKNEGKRFIMLTAYDFGMAGILDEAQVPVILVGDSLAQVVLGYETTIPVTMDEMLHHTKAVSRGAPNCLIVADMPFGSYQNSRHEALSNAVRFMKEGGAQAVKLEGPKVEITQYLVDQGIPVMAHLGLAPQSVHAVGGYMVQARTQETADRLQTDAEAMEKAGAFSMVLEAIPAALAATVTACLSIPTIGIGAGSGTDAQVLVINDLLGMSPGKGPKFVKAYANLRQSITAAVETFRSEVEAGQFPDEEHSYQ